MYPDRIVLSFCLSYFLSLLVEPIQCERNLGYSGSDYRFLCILRNFRGLFILGSSNPKILSLNLAQLS